MGRGLILQNPSDMVLCYSHTRETRLRCHQSRDFTFGHRASSHLPFPAMPDGITVDKRAQQRHACSERVVLDESVVAVGGRVRSRVVAVGPRFAASHCAAAKLQGRVRVVPGKPVDSNGRLQRWPVYATCLRIRPHQPGLVPIGHGLRARHVFVQGQHARACGTERRL